MSVFRRKKHSYPEAFFIGPSVALRIIPILETMLVTALLGFWWSVPWWAGGITIFLLAGTIYVRRTKHKAFTPIAKGPEPAPWEHEGGTDLTMPSGALEAIKPPVGSKMRPATPAVRLTPALIEDVAKGLEKIPPFPDAVLKVFKELDSASSTAKSVADILSTEPVLTATLLRVANSASTGLGREIVTVPDAVAYLGFSSVKALLFRLKVGRLFSKPSRSGGYNAEKLWVHSMAVAQVAEELARRAGRTDPQLAMTVGLLHDIGKVAINCQFPETVRELWKGGGAADESFLAREQRLFGADHAFVGGYLAERWKLPDELVEMVKLHHLPREQPISLRPEARRSLFAVCVANQLVKFCHVYCEDMEIDIIPEQVMTELGLPLETEKLLDRRMQEIIQKAAMLGAPAGDRPQPRSAAA